MSHAALNRIYRLVWSRVNNCWVAVAETAKGRGKDATKRKLSIAAFLLSSPALALAGLEGASIVGGQGAIVNPNLVQQDSARLAIHAQGFGVGIGETFTLKQNYLSDIALIRVLGQNPSDILGSINARGQLFISNPNGILFGPESQINVGGLVGTSLDISREDFMAGKINFHNSGSAGSVINQGKLSAADGGYIALLAPQVRNEGIIRTTLGSSLIGAGDEITLNISNGSLLSYTIDKGAINALAENRQLIHADGGQVFMGAKAADSLSTAVVNNTGIIKAGRVTNQGGVISLHADYTVQTGTLDVSSTHDAGDITINSRVILDAGQAKANSSQGDGGNIHYHANSITQTASAKTQANSTASAGQGGNIHLHASDNFFSSGTVTATGSGESGQGGTIDALGNRVVLAAAALDASGAHKGGKIRIGGDFHGANAQIQNADTTIINGATHIKADGGQGQVAVWSDSKTDFYGNISADKAGMIEVSSKGTLTYAGNATAGVGGQLLLDPANIIIDTNAGPAAFELYDPNPADNNRFGQITKLLGTTVDGVFTPNGNVAINSFNNNVATNAGALYIFNTVTGELVSALSGSQANDYVGIGWANPLTSLSNGYYLLNNNQWGGGGLYNGAKGALTWFNGATGVNGIVSGANSLVGNQTGDMIGSGGITTLSNGSYLIFSPNWGSNGVANMGKGAITWVKNDTGITGELSAINSLVGRQIGDRVGSKFYYGGLNLIDLSNDNYILASPHWGSNGAFNTGLGAVTWFSAATGITGEVSSANSLVGTNANDYIGSGGITILSNGNYVVASPQWSDGVNAYLGAATWINGATGQDMNGLRGSVVSGANSLVGTRTGDNVSSAGITALTNGNYVVNSPYWSNGSQTAAGAATLGNGTTGTSGIVSSSNSLVGTTANSNIGASSTALTNGNYVVSSNGSYRTSTGSLLGSYTWINGTTGQDMNGVLGSAVSSANSFVGDQNLDYLGACASYCLAAGITALPDGNYLILSPNWRQSFYNGQSLGALTWGNGTTGSGGVVSSTNSLVGSSIYDFQGASVKVLPNGNYVLITPNLKDPDGIANGAVTFGSGSTGTSGVINSSISFMGGGQVLTFTDSSNYIVQSYTTNGAATWIDGASGQDLNGIKGGYANASNSLIGGQPGDGVGSGGVDNLGNGNYLLKSPGWNNGAAESAGAVTWFNIHNGLPIGILNSSNSLVGSHAYDRVGSTYDSTLTPLVDGYFLLANREWGGNNVWNMGKGAITLFNGAVGITGEINSTNSLVGSQTGDLVGNATLTDLNNGNYALTNSYWGSNGVWGQGKGALTWFNVATGLVGEVGSANSLVGTQAGDSVGISGIQALGNNQYLVNNYLWGSLGVWNNRIGALTVFDGTTGVKGEVSNTNSMLGGESLTVLADGNYVVVSPGWDNAGLQDVGAVTWINAASGISGVVINETNSLIGSHAGDKIGSYGIYELANGNYVVNSPDWNNGTGAITWGNAAGGTHGIVSAENSLVGNQPGDYIGGYDIYPLANGNYVVISTDWANGVATRAGAVTWMNGTTGEDMNGLKGSVVSSINSLVGSQTDDQVGSNGIFELPDSNYVISSPDKYNGAYIGAGASTFGNGSSGTAGVVASTNSFVGTAEWEYFGYYNPIALEGGNYILVNDYTGTDYRGWVKVAMPGNIAFNNGLGQTVTFNPEQLTNTLASGTDITLQASNDITINQDILIDGNSGGNLTMQAGRNINLNADIITANGNFTAIAGDPSALAEDLQAGIPTINISAGNSIIAGTGSVILRAIGGDILNGGTINASETLLQADKNVTLEAGSSIQTTGITTIVAGERFINNSGSSSPITASQWFIYSVGKSHNTLDGIVADGERYQQTYTGSIPGYATQGNWLMYSMTPNVLFVKPTTQIVTQGGSLAPFNFTLSGFINGDDYSTAKITGTPVFTDGNTNVKGFYNIDYVGGLSSNLDYVFMNKAVSIDELIVVSPPPAPSPLPSIGTNAYLAANNVPYNISPTTSQMGNEGFIRTTDAEHPYALTEVTALLPDNNGAADINALDFDGNGSTDEIRSNGKLELVVEDGGIHLPDDLIETRTTKKSTIQRAPRVIRTKHTL